MYGERYDKDSWVKLDTIVSHGKLEAKGEGAKLHIKPIAIIEIWHLWY